VHLVLRQRLAADIQYVQERAELRSLVARALEQQSAPIVNDAVAVFPFAGLQTVAADSHNRLAELILQLLAVTARDGEIDARNELLADLHQAAEDKGISVRQLFGLIYLVERAALDELALDESFGATTEPWPALAQLLRRSSFDLLSAYAERLNAGPGQKALVDALTTLHTRAVLVAALEKEIQRSERFGHPFALILIDVDRLSEINAKHGYGSGDRVLERIGILMRKYFREQDWVARLSGDAFAVLLPETPREHAAQLAERVRSTVEARIALHDYRSEEQVPVTVSVAVLFADSVDAKVRAEGLIDEAREAVFRAKLAGRNRVQEVRLAAAHPSAPTRDAKPNL
jgi:diguanylate cyclase (GGDEF)-like protein